VVSIHDERCAASRIDQDGQQRARNQNHQAAGERDRAGSVQGRLEGERMTFDQLADRTPEESASAAMQLSLALSAAERAKDPTQELPHASDGPSLV
jgi:hypothetical protein